jgi:hypothetical protein
MLKDNWVDKVDGADVNSAEDINQIARATIALENSTSEINSKIQKNIKDIEDLKNQKVEIEIDSELSEFSENPVQNKVITSKINEVNNRVQIALDDAGNANELASQNRGIIEDELKPNIATALSESGQAYIQVSEALTRIDILQLEKADVLYVDEKIGDIDNALEELHTYAQALIGGEA